MEGEEDYKFGYFVRKGCFYGTGYLAASWAGFTLLFCEREFNEGILEDPYFCSFKLEALEFLYVVSL